MCQCNYCHVVKKGYVDSWTLVSTRLAWIIHLDSSEKDLRCWCRDEWTSETMPTISSIVKPNLCLSKSFQFIVTAPRGNRSPQNLLHQCLSFWKSKGWPATGLTLTADGSRWHPEADQALVTLISGSVLLGTLRIPAEPVPLLLQACDREERRH